MKSNPSPSSPLNLCPPTGITGTTLPDSPVKDTPAPDPAVAVLQGFMSSVRGESPKRMIAFKTVVKVPAPASPVESLPYWEADGPGEEIKFAAVDSVGVTPPGSGRDAAREVLKALQTISPTATFRAPVDNEPVYIGVHGMDALGVMLDERDSLLASHAAKDAKIKALESALKAFTGHQIFCSDGDDTAPKYRCRCHACISVRSAERALALPCA